MMIMMMVMLNVIIIIMICNLKLPTMKYKKPELFVTTAMRTSSPVMKQKSDPSRVPSYGNQLIRPAR